MVVRMNRPNVLEAFLTAVERSLSASPVTKPAPPKSAPPKLNTSKWCSECGERLAADGECPACTAPPSAPQSGGRIYVGPRTICQKPTPEAGFMQQAEIDAKTRKVPLYVAMSDLAKARPDLYEAHLEAAGRLRNVERDLEERDAQRRSAALAERTAAMHKRAMARMK